MLATYTHISVDAQGKILAAYRGDPSRFGSDGYIALPEPAEFDPSRTYFADGGVVDMGEPPSERSVFDYVSKSWVEPPTSEYEIEMSWAALRIERNRKLADSDWTQVGDANVDKAAWAEYRQALRDMPSNTDDPSSPVWPTPPA